MRYKLWITLIVCGTLLVVLPPLSDYMASFQASKILAEQKEFQRINYKIAPMSIEYRFGCLALGAAMIGIGVLCGWRESDRNPVEQDEFS